MNVAPEPDTKDWTWVLEDLCPECGFDAREPRRGDLADLTVRVTERWRDLRDVVVDPRRRPSPAVWSPLEYACHVRDVYDLAVMRTLLMRDEDDPTFENWDQDATAIEDDYAGQDPARVWDELVVAGIRFAEVLAALPDDAWDRPGRRSNGSHFTIESFTRYILHDVVHHLTDITGDAWSA